MTASLGIAVLPGSAAEFAAAHDQRFLQQPALFEILDQGGDRLIDLLGQWTVRSMSPCTCQLLLEPTSNSSITRTPRSISRRVVKHCQPNDFRSSRSTPYSFKVASLSAEMSNASGVLTHQSVSRVEVGHPRLQLRVPGMNFEMFLVQVAEHDAFKFLSLDRLDAAGQVRDRIGAGNDPDARVEARQEIRIPALIGVVRFASGKDDKGGQVCVERANGMTHPRTDARQRNGDRTGMHAKCRGGMSRRGIGHRVNQTELIDHRTDMRKQLRDHPAGLAIPLKGKLRSLDRMLSPFLPASVFSFGLWSNVSRAKCHRS